MRFYNYPQDNAAQSRTLSLLHGFQPFNQMHAVVLVSIRCPPVMPPVPYSDFRVWWEGKEIISVVYPVLRLRPTHGRMILAARAMKYLWRAPQGAARSLDPGSRSFPRVMVR